MALSFLGAPAFASEQATGSTAGGLFQVLLVLILVLALLIGAAWLLKRVNVPGITSGNAVKVVGGIAVGGRERIMVIEVADQWIVVGVTQQQINALTTMPKQDISPPSEDISQPRQFSCWLKQLIEKKDGK